MNSFIQIVYSCLSMLVLVKGYPISSYSHLEESGNSLGYGEGEEDYHHNHKHEPAKPYNFGYKVYDPHHGTDFSQNEHSDGDTVKGQYQVVLPDGRIQQVTYTADWKNGYHADVQYHGKAIDTSSGYHGGAGDYSSGSQSYDLSEHSGYTPSYTASLKEHSYSGY